MPDLPYRSLIWLNYRLAATFAFGLPLAILIWSAIRKETSIMRLLTIYWKIASLAAISMLLLTDRQPIGYLTSFLAPLLMVFSVWFWVDLNEELAELPSSRPLPLTVKIWRWALTIYCLISTIISFSSLNCMKSIGNPNCLTWIEAPMNSHLISKKLFGFLFGANWNEPLAAFIGYVALTGYIVGIVYWVLIKLPKQGRIAGDF